AKPSMPGGLEHPQFPTNRSMIQAGNRGTMFDKFLDSIGKRGADTIIAPLGEDGFTGVGHNHGESSQVCIRTQGVADRLNAQLVAP
ncbi:hypothetical protein ACFQ1S_46060, partial [Kibdelosporangium lantanae]